MTLDKKGGPTTLQQKGNLFSNNNVSLISPAYCAGFMFRFNNRNAVIGLGGE